MIFKLYDCDFGVTLNDVNYDFTHIDNLQVEDPERNKLIRGGNASNKIGLVYKEGLKEPKTVTLTIIGMPKEVHDLLKTAYNEQTRMDCYTVSRVDGSSKIAKNCILAQEPKQNNLDGTPESMNTALVFETYDTTEIHKT